MPENQGNPQPEGHVNALPAGHVVDKYRIGGVLGSGGFGIVYRGQHRELGDVAIKEYLPLEIAVRVGSMVQPHSSQSRELFEEGLRRFLEEAKCLVQFNHPNVVRCREFCRANGTAYLIMDFEDGLPLSGLLRQREEQGKSFNGDEIKQIILPLLDGLAEVHAHKVLHRDIKPSNIFIRRSTEQPVLIDFGAAKQDFAEHTQTVWAHTQGYAPMEQIERDGKLGPWTDIYAVGAVMWRIVAGDNPPWAEDRMSAKLRRSEDPMKPAEELGEKRYSPALLKAIDKCLSLQGKGRYQSVDKLGRALRRAKQYPIENLHFRAHHGDAEARFELGKEYYCDKYYFDSRVDVPQDMSEAVAWWQQAAEQGHVDAQIELGYALYNGEGVSADKQWAAGWWEAAVEQGDPRAQYLLGVLYLELFGFTDAAANKAAECWRLAAEQGHAAAQYRLGNLYSEGWGVPEDKCEAMKWWRLAAERGHADAWLSLDDRYSEGNGMSSDRNEAVKRYRLVADHEPDRVLWHHIGYLYDDDGMEMDYREAYVWYWIAEHRHAKS